MSTQRPTEFDPIECIAEAISRQYGNRGGAPGSLLPAGQITALDRDIAQVAWSALRGHGESFWRDPDDRLHPEPRVRFELEQRVLVIPIADPILQSNPQQKEGSNAPLQAAPPAHVLDDSGPERSPGVRDLADVARPVVRRDGDPDEYAGNRFGVFDLEELGFLMSGLSRIGNPHTDHPPLVALRREVAEAVTARTQNA